MLISTTSASSVVDVRYAISAHLTRALPHPFDGFAVARHRRTVRCAPCGDFGLGESAGPLAATTMPLLFIESSIDFFFDRGRCAALRLVACSGHYLIDRFASIRAAVAARSSAADARSVAHQRMSVAPPA
jgi:hypothetical protein